MPGLYKKHTATQQVMPEMRLEPINLLWLSISLHWYGYGIVHSEHAFTNAKCGSHTASRPSEDAVVLVC